MKRLKVGQVMQGYANSYSDIGRKLDQARTISEIKGQLVVAIVRYVEQGLTVTKIYSRGNEIF